MARKATRTFAVPMWSLKENRLMQPGEKVPMDHLTDEEYTLINDLYPEDQDPDEARRFAEMRAKDAESLNNRGS